MGTAKRERQKANRIQRQIEEQRAERVSSVRRTATRVGLIGVLAIAGVVIIAWIGGAFGGDDDDVADVPADVDLADDAADAAVPEVQLPEVLPDDLVISTLIAGTGPEAAEGDTLNVHYVGVRSEDGTQFDTNFGGSTFPVTLGTGSVIQGWEEGLIGAQEGGRYQLDIPADLAYGDRGSGSIIQPGDALTFVVDVVSLTQG